jgi:uncharacterized protein YggL (DUF469 family)
MRNNKQQSSVESLLDKIQLSQTTFTDSDGNKYIFLYPILSINDIEKCKEMHKQEMIEFANDLLAQNDINYIAVPNLAEQYYNETYGGGEQ